MSKNREPQTLQDAIRYFADTDRCIAYLAERRWPDGVVVCPTCGRRDVAYFPARRVWQCKSRHPKCQFSIKVGTIFEDSPIALGSWLTAMWMIANCKNGVSSWEIHRAIGVTQKTAWFMLHRIRRAMGTETPHRMGGSDGGPLEVDETFVGGKVSNMHRKTALKRGLSRTGGAEKAIVMGLLDRELRQVRAKVIPNVKREVLQAEILRQVEKGSTVYTDGHVGYDNLAAQEYVRETVNRIWSTFADRSTLRG
ncbi:MAG: IS1595 family transposase [Terracidiphilus sp.]